jgi:hypothetical protein
MLLCSSLSIHSYCVVQLIVKFSVQLIVKLSVPIIVSALCNFTIISNAVTALTLRTSCEYVLIKRNIWLVQYQHVPSVVYLMHIHLHARTPLVYVSLVFAAVVDKYDLQ